MAGILRRAWAASEADSATMHAFSPADGRWASREFDRGGLGVGRTLSPPRRTPPIGIGPIAGLDYSPASPGLDTACRAPIPSLRLHLGSFPDNRDQARRRAVPRGRPPSSFCLGVSRPASRACRTGHPFRRFAMRQARFLPPRRRWLSRVMPLLGLVLTGWGCQQPPTYFYYGSGSPALRAGRAGSHGPRQRQARRTAHRGHRGRHDVRRNSPAAPRPSSGREAPPPRRGQRARDRPATSWRQQSQIPSRSSPPQRRGCRDVARIPAASPGNRLIARSDADHASDQGLRYS